METFLIVLMVLTAIFLIALVLVQKGRGGGLAGALGGMGGQSAFGAKAGDLFTRVTVIVAGFWIVLSIGTFYYISHRGGPLNVQGAAPGIEPQPGTTESGAGAGEKPATGQEPTASEKPAAGQEPAAGEKPAPSATGAGAGGESKPSSSE